MQVDRWVYLRALASLHLSVVRHKEVVIDKVNTEIVSVSFVEIVQL